MNFTSQNMPKNFLDCACSYYRSEEVYKGVQIQEKSFVLISVANLESD